MADPTAVLGDLRDEGEDLDRLVSAAGDEQWTLPTPAGGWTVAHQIAHLLWTDERALLSATDPAAFAQDAARALTSPESFVDDGTEGIVAAYEKVPPGC